MHKSNFLRTLDKALKVSSCSSLKYRNYITRDLPFHKHIINLAQVRCNFFRFVQTDASKCWSCGANRTSITDLLCNRCNVIQHPHDTENYFKVLDVREDFDVDQKALTSRYRKLQSILHPDKFSNKSEAEKTISADSSALVNRAYNTLQTPLNRAIHMLSLRGVQIEEDQKVTDPEFLMEIMELNEEVEAANTPEQLKQLNEKNKEVLQKIGIEISSYFRENQLEKAKDSMIKMKYYNSVSLHINGLLRERGIVD